MGLGPLQSSSFEFGEHHSERKFSNEKRGNFIFTPSLSPGCCCCCIHPPPSQQTTASTRLDPGIQQPQWPSFCCTMPSKEARSCGITEKGATFFCSQKKPSVYAHGGKDVGPRWSARLARSERLNQADTSGSRQIRPRFCSAWRRPQGA